MSPSTQPPEFLDHIFMMQGLDSIAIAALTIAAEEKLYLRNQEIIQEGQFGSSLYIIGKGRVEVVVGLNEDNQTNLAELGEGEVFGEMSVIEAVERSASVRALEPTLVYSITGAALDKFRRFWPDQHALMIMNLARNLSKRLRLLDEAFAARGGLSTTVVHTFAAKETAAS